MSDASETAYSVIRSEIIAGRYKPGVRLTEEELADHCKVSRTPVRDALRRLAAEDLVRIIPRQGTFVRNLSEAEVDEIFEMRAMLEGYGARRAATRIGTDACTQLGILIAEIDQALEHWPSPDLSSFLKANRQIHAIITEATDSTRLSQMIARLTEQPIIARTAQLYSADDLKRSNDHHRELLAAFETGDPVWAEAVMTSHIKAAHQVYRRTFASVEEKAAAE